MAKKPKREKLVKIITRELLARGYKLVEPQEPGTHGVWTHRTWNGATDHIATAIQDCVEREER